jgi:hypothetical protein
MSQRLLWAAALLFGVGGAGILAYAGYVGWNSSSAPPLRIENPDLVINHVSVGVSTNVNFSLIFDCDEPARVLGADTRCNSNCCFGPKTDEWPSFVLRGRTALPFELYVSKPDTSFSAYSTLLIHWRGRVLSYKVTVSGTATPAF